MIIGKKAAVTVPYRSKNRNAFAGLLDKWFCDTPQTADPAGEYIRFSCFFMAYEYAKAILQKE